MSSSSSVAAIPVDVLGVCRKLQSAGHQAHLVGGGIRDLLIGRTPADFDVATNALPQVVLDLFGSRFAIPTGLQHGTITVLTGEPPRHIEVTTFRGEGEYLDGRRPSSVSFSATLVEDLARRDFTMNAIAFDPLSQVLTDPFDGQADLQRKLVKAVGDAIQRFTEDGLRPMRAIRQATVLDFTIEVNTFAAITETRDSFRKVSGERIRDELFKMFRAPKPARGVRLMLESQLLQDVLPELVACRGVDKPSEAAIDVFEHSLAVLDALPPRADLRLAGLLHDVGRAREGHGAGAADEATHAADGGQMMSAIASRLRLSAAERRLLVDLTALHELNDDPLQSDAQMRASLRRWRERGDRGEDVLTLHLANRCADGPHSESATRAKAFVLRARDVMKSQPPLAVKDLAVDGKTLMQALNLKPGRGVGSLLEQLLDVVIETPESNRQDALLECARRLVADRGAS